MIDGDTLMADIEWRAVILAPTPSLTACDIFAEEGLLGGSNYGSQKSVTHSHFLRVALSGEREYVGEEEE